MFVYDEWHRKTRSAQADGRIVFSIKDGDRPCVIWWHIREKESVSTGRRMKNRLQRDLVLRSKRTERDPWCP